MKSSDEDRCPVAPPPRSCLRSGPIRSRRVTFSQEEEDPGEAQTLLTPPPKPQLTLTSDDDVTLSSQEVGVSADRQLFRDGRGHTWSVESLQRTSPRCVGVSDLSVVLGGLLQLVDQHWTGPGSLQRHHQFLGGAYDLLSELLQPAGGAVLQDEVGVGFSELVHLRRKLDRSELQLERMKTCLLSALKENYRLKHQLSSGQKTHTP